MENNTVNLLVWVSIFFLMVLRISAIFTVSPIFGRRNMPSMAKIALSILIAYITINIYPPDDSRNYNNIIQYTMVCIKELSIGLIIGMVTTVFFSAVYAAGQLIDMQIGFSFSQIFDPQINSEIPLTGNLLQTVLIICFFFADGHHLLIRLITDTFRIIPVGNEVIRPQIALSFAEIFVNSFVIAVKIAMPVLAASLVTEVTLGILMRVVPQMNFFAVGFPIKIILGLLILIMFIPVFVNSGSWIFENMMDGIKKTFEGLV